MQFQLSGGFLRFGNWCELKVQNGLGEWHDGGFHLVSLRTQSEEGGKAVFKGVQPIAEEGVSRFDVDLTEFPLEQLLGEKSLGRMPRRLFFPLLLDCGEKPLLVMHTFAFTHHADVSV